MRLSGKVTLVTGGTRGIGRTLVERFAEAGSSVVFTGRSKDAGEQVEAEARERGLDVRFANGSEHLELSLSHRLVVNDTNACVAAGIAGLGVVQVPTYGVHPALTDGRLVPVLEDWRTGSIPVYVIYPPNRYLSAKVRVFIDWVVALFERHEFLRRDRVDR